MFRSAKWLSLNAFGAVLVVAAFVLTGPAGAITYGTIDEGHRQVGAILVPWKGEYIEWCSGTLVSPRVFLTAGHCTAAMAFYEFSPDVVRVSFSLYLFGKGAKWLEVIDYFSHPEYGGGWSDPHDIGVVILKKPVQSIAPGRLPYEGFLDDLYAAGMLAGATFINVGYGTDENIQDTNVRMFSVSSFRNLHDAWLYMSQNPHLGNGGTCFGDSGGPTYYRDASGVETQVAVTSWGDAVCKSQNNNYRVDTASSLAFIGDAMRTYA